ncbi:hypothetical protein ABPG74_022725 [Tetrahymena malaccensis]
MGCGSSNAHDPKLKDEANNEKVDLKKSDKKDEKQEKSKKEKEKEMEKEKDKKKKEKEKEKKKKKKDSDGEDNLQKGIQVAEDLYNHISKMKILE